MATVAIDHYAAQNSHQFPLRKRRLSERPNHQHLQKAVSPRQIIGDALRQRVENIDVDLCHPDEEDTFFVADLGDVYRQYQRWKLNLPRVRPFYGKLSLFTPLHGIRRPIPAAR
jgi:ornithine decarboxylase